MTVGSSAISMCPLDDMCSSESILILTLHRLPFLYDPDVALGIAVKTYFDDILPNDPNKAQKKAAFPGTYVPYALNFAEDLDIACSFFDAIYAGVQTLDAKDLPAADRAVWDKAAKYLELRR